MTHHQCPHNVYIGFTCRHLLDNNPAPEWLQHTRRGTVMSSPHEPLPGVGVTQTQIIQSAHDVARRWVAGRTCALQSTTEYLGKFTGARYNRLAQSINKQYVRGSMSWGVTGFVKCDKYDEHTALNKAPRMIQFRDPAVNAELGKFMGPIEHELLLGPGLGPSGTPECSKGMNLTQRAQVWAQKRSTIRDPVCLLADFSKFDAHVHTHVLELEHAVWRQMAALPLKMLDKQRINYGTAAGHKYTAVGTRMSGDRNTGGGNSIINVLIVRSIAALANVEIEFICDGDDSMIWVSREHKSKLVKWLDVCVPRVFGMRLEIEVALRQADEEYCHTALAYDDNAQPICIVDPLRTLTRLCWTINKCGRAQIGKIFVGNLVALYLMYPNTPILSRCSYALLNSMGALEVRAEDAVVCANYVLGGEDWWTAEKQRYAINAHQTLLGKVRTVLPRRYLQVSEDARSQVFSSFRIAPEEQIMIERTWHLGELNPEMRLKVAAGKPHNPVELLVECDTTTMVYG